MLSRFFKKEKSNAKSQTTQTRVLRLETLETRALLSVAPTEYAEIRELYSAFELPVDSAEVNIVDLSAAATSKEVQAALDAAKTTPQDDLIVLRVAADDHTLTLDGNPLVVDVAPENGGVYIVALADDGSNASLTVDTQNMSRAFSVLRGDVGLANMDIYGQTWSFDQGAAYDGLIRVRNVADLTVENVDIYVAPTDVVCEAPSLGEAAQGLPGDCLVPTDYALAASPSDLALSVDGSLISEAESSAAPYGAGEYDSSLYLAGNVRVTLTIMESNGAVDANVCNWSASQINAVKAKTREALDWWETMFDKYNPNSPIGLSFTVDYTDATTPFQTSYEPITRSAEDENLWVGEYLTSKGYSGTYTAKQSHLSDMRAFNVAQRDANGADWAYSIFVVHSRRPDNSLIPSQSGAAGDFAGGGAGAYAWIGGPNVVVSYDCRGWGIDGLGTVIAHETGHIFHAPDEYAGSGSYNDVSGYYGIQNTNAYEDNPNPSSRVPSIMADANLQSQAWSGYTSATSALQTIGWRDSDGDGLIDALDTPLTLTGRGKYDAEQNTFTFAGKSSVTTLENAMTDWRKSDVTLNTVDRLEYKLDDGAWTTLATVSGTSNVSASGVVNLGDAKLISFRTVCDRSGVTSATLTFDPFNDPFHPLDDPLRVTTALDVVDDTDGVVSLREALAVAHEGDAVTFAAALKGQTIALNGAEIELSNAVTVDASTLYDVENDVPGLTLDAGGKSRVFYVRGGTAENPVELIGLKIADGSAPHAGGVMVHAGAALSAKDCVFVDNKTTNTGGGGLCVDGWADLENCVFSGNSAASDGGGIYVASNASLTATGLAVSNNSAGSGGGGLHVAGSGTATVTNSSFTGNEAAWGGGWHICGAATGDNVTIDGNKSSGIDLDSAGTLTLKNSTISNNIATGDGGGIYLGGSATLENVAITGNQTAGNGGGLRVNGTLTATGLTIAGNTATNQGGGVNVGGTATLTDSTISGNVADWGGGAIVWGNLTLTNSRVGENEATSGGGGIYVGGEATFLDATVAANSAGGDGGGIYVAGTLTATGLTVVDNTAVNQGGGLKVNGTTTLANSTISGNSAAWGGGAVVWADLVLTNSLVVENKATSGGGGFYIGGKATFRNATIAANNAGWGGGLQASSAEETILYNTILATNVGGDVVDDATLKAYNVLSGYTAWDAGSNNVAYNASQPLFKDASNGDYRLSSDSQAVDKGNGAYAVDAVGNALTTDLAGRPRFNGTVDLGAYEYWQAEPLSPPSLSVSPESSTSLSVAIGAVANASGYALEYSTTSDFATKETQTFATAGTYSLTGLSANTTYYVRVLAKGDGASYFDSSWSSVESATTAKIALTSVTLSGTAKVGETLTASVSPSDATSTYQWYRGTSTSNMTAISGATSPTYALTSADVGYYVQVVATGTGDFSGSVSATTASAVQTNMTRLSTPGLTVSAASSSSLAVTIGSVANASSYTLEYSTTADFATKETQTFATSGTYSLTGLSANAKYYVRVQAIGDGVKYSNSAWSSVKNATTSKIALTTVTLNGTAQVGETLTASVSPNDATATYQWYRVAANSEAIRISGATSSTYKLTSADAGYYVQVVATGAGDFSGSVSATTATAVPAAQLSTPSLSVSAASSSSLKVTIGKSANASSYALEYSTTADFATKETQTFATSGTYLLTGLSANAKYYVRVQAIGDGVKYSDSAWSSVKNATTSKIALTTVTLDGTTQVGETLTASVSPNGASATYKWYRVAANSEATRISGATSSTYTLTSADVGYYVQVVATGTGDYRDSVSATTATAVSALQLATPSLSVAAETSTSLSVEIGAVANASGYAVEYSTTADFATKETQTFATSGTFALTGLSANATYYVRVLAQGNGTTFVDSAWSTVQSATTEKIALTTVTLNGTAQVGETLTASVSPNDATATYQWYRVAANSETTAISGATSSTYALTSADVGYYVQVVATGTGDFVGSVTAAIDFVPPAAPTDVKFGEYDASARSATLTWTDNATNEVRYEVRVSVDDGATWTAAPDLAANATSLVCGDMSGGKTRLFQIRAVSASGLASDWAGAALRIPAEPTLDVLEYVVEQNAAFRLAPSGALGDGLTYYWDLSGSEVEETSNFVERGADFWTSVEELGLGVGEHTIRVRTRDADGCFSPSVAAVLRVVATPPTIDVTTASSADGSILRLSFQATTPDNSPIASWRLDWGDGQTSEYAQLSDALTAGHYYAPTAEDAVYEVSLTVVDATGNGADVVYALTSHSVSGIGAASQAVEETSALGGDVAKEAAGVDVASFEVAAVELKSLSIEAERVSVADDVDATAVLTATGTAFDSASRGGYWLSLPDAVSTTECRDAALEAFASTSVLDGGDFATDCGADIWGEIEAALIDDETSRKSKRRDPFESFDVWGDDLENLGAFGF